MALRAICILGLPALHTLLTFHLLLSTATLSTALSTAAATATAATAATAAAAAAAAVAALAGKSTLKDLAGLFVDDREHHALEYSSKLPLQQLPLVRRDVSWIMLEHAATPRPEDNCIHARPIPGCI